MSQPHAWADLSVQQLAQAAIKQLQSVADPKVAAQAQAFFKAHEKVLLIGVRTPNVRQIERELFQQIKGQWALAEACAFTDLLLQDPRQEAKTVGILLLARFHKSFVPELFEQFERWLQQNLCANWALTDALGAYVLALLWRRCPELLPQLTGWTQAENLWVRRASAVSLVPLARKGEHLEVAYSIAELLFPYSEDLIHKANGWLLRDAGKTDPDRLQTFLLSHGAHMPRTTLRYAIERFPAAERKRLLELTR